MDRAIVALLGHSFIGRLHTAVLDSNFPFNSDLNQDIFDVHYFGRSGATTKTLLSSRHIQDCIECKPVRVFLQISGNDIRKNTTYVDVFKGIRFVVDRLIAGGVQHIIIGSIFNRSKPRGITSDEYNSKADQLNRFLHYNLLPKTLKTLNSGSFVDKFDRRRTS